MSLVIFPYFRIKKQPFLGLPLFKRDLCKSWKSINHMGPWTWHWIIKTIKDENGQNDKLDQRHHSCCPPFHTDWQTLFSFQEWIQSWLGFCVLRLLQDEYLTKYTPETFFEGYICFNILRYLKGLSHEIFLPVYWPVWIHLGLNMNRLWFLNFNGAPLS